MKLHKLLKRITLFLLIMVAAIIVATIMAIFFLFYFRTREVPLYFNLLWGAFCLLVGLAFFAGFLFILKKFDENHNDKIKSPRITEQFEKGKGNRQEENKT